MSSTRCECMWCVLTVPGPLHRVSEMSLGEGRGVGRKKRVKNVNVHPMRKSDPNPPSKVNWLV